jgi:23S rRNA pseudouridine955/2504/2580 synthase
MEKNRFIITRDDAGIKLHKWLKKSFENMPLSAIHKSLRQKKVKHNGKRAKGDEVLNEGDEVRIFFDPGQFSEQNKKVNLSTIPQKIINQNIEVIFEDEFLLAVNKPAGVSVHPGSGTAKNRSMIELAQAKYPSFNIRLAHRLDKDTSGVLLFAKDGGTLRKLLVQLRKHQFAKQYVALLSGRLQNDSGTIDLAISREKSGPKIARYGKKSVTHYAVRKRFKNATLVEIKLETGRMHQIRTHFAAIHHPVLGDDKHGDFEQNKTFKKHFGLKRQFLHAEQLGFVHPETEVNVLVKAVPPEDLRAVISGLSADSD